MKKTKMEKGITLVALIITIVVLLILAVVSINSMINDGIIGKAQGSADKFNGAQGNEQGILDGYEEELNKYNGGSGSGNGTGSGGEEVDVTDGTTMFAKTTNTKIEDIYGNKITIPAGFKISVDNTGYTKDAIDVTKGIVIEDASGNQFVWIPVGKIYTDTAKTEANAKTVTLGRYSNFTATDGVYTPAQTAENYATSTTINSYYTEDISSSKGNAVSRDLEAFITSVIGNDEKEGNGGYYIGRYEAGDSDSTEARTSSTGNTNTMVCKSNQQVYNYVTQGTASSLAQGMYPDGYKADGTGTFSSDLINSYAWDTAIIFIQTFGTNSNSATYASTVGKSTTSKISLTGTNILNATSRVDEQLNIYDMAGGCRECSTESSSYTMTVPPPGSKSPYVSRGSYYSDSSVGTDQRKYGGAMYTDVFNSFIGFRPLLYVAI